MAAIAADELEAAKPVVEITQLALGAHLQAATLRKVHVSLTTSVGLGLKNVCCLLPQQGPSLALGAKG